MKPPPVPKHFLAFAALLSLVSMGRAEPTPAPDFELPKWESVETVKLADFAGKIIVLDFFAYWCAPCRKASIEIEGGIQKYYAARKGNPDGVPVRVISINIERDNPRLTLQRHFPLALTAEML